MFGLLLVGLTAVLGFYLGKGIVFLVDASKTTIDFQMDTSFDVTIDEENDFYLMLDDNSYEVSPLTECDVNTANSFASTFQCNDGSDFSYYTRDIKITMYNQDTDTYIYFDDMGNTSITSNEYEAIGRITLKKGTYTITTSSNMLFDESNLRLEDTQLVIGIVGVVFASLGLVGSLIGAIILLTMAKSNKKDSTDQYAYYDSQMNKQDHNQELFDEDDPFSKYDLD